MAISTTTNVLEMLKYTYGTERVLYLLSREVPLWNILKRKKVPLGGRGQFIMPITVKNAGTWIGITEGGTLPTGLAPDTTEATWSLQEFAGMYEVSWKLLQDARKSEFAFARAIQFLEDTFTNRYLRLINADLLSDGRGVLGMLPAADNQVGVTIKTIPRVDIGVLVDLLD